MRPLIRPASATSVTASRMANGETQPSSVTGTARARTTPTSEPAIAPTLMAAIAAAAVFSMTLVSSRKKDAGKSGDGDEGVEGVGIRPFIRQSPANEVTQRQEKQHQANDVGPDDVGRAIDGLQHAAGGKFDRQGAHAGHKNGHIQIGSIDCLVHAEGIIAGSGQ